MTLGIHNGISLVGTNVDHHHIGRSRICGVDGLHDSLGRARRPPFVIGFDLFTECLSLLFLLLSGSAPGWTCQP
jgi:hypothetical protein